MISEEMLRVDGKSVWSTSASMILSEFTILQDTLDVDILPHILHLAFDLFEVPINVVNAIEYFLKGIALNKHSTQWTRLNHTSVILTLDKLGNWIPKIDPELASIFIYSENKTPAEVEQNSIATLIHFFMTWTSRKTRLQMNDFFDSPDVEMGILMLAFQEGLTPREALLTPPFQNEMKKKFLLEELNSFVKKLNSEQSKKARIALAKAREKLERNSPLVIGGKGAWNVGFMADIVDDFASKRGRGYDIISFADLLRIIRNIFQHGHENPKCMLAAFGKANPSYMEMMEKFHSLFPFLYLHSLNCFSNLVEGRSVPKLYLDTYDKFETELCNRGLANYAVLPLKMDSKITLSFESANADAVTEDIVLEGRTRSCVDFFIDIFPLVIKTLTRLWPYVPAESLIIRCRGKTINISKASTEVNVFYLPFGQRQMTYNYTPVSGLRPPSHGPQNRPQTPKQTYQTPIHASQTLNQAPQTLNQAPQT